MLCLLAGFTIVRFLLNFDQLELLAEQSGSNHGLNASGFAESGVTARTSPGAALPAGEESIAFRAWLAPLNHYRAMAGLPPVTADASLSHGDFLHSHYLSVNYAPQLPELRLGAEAHMEDPGKPGFSAEGAAAADASDVDWMWGSNAGTDSSWAIDNWMQAPFHRMQIINPYLRAVGYGTDCLGKICFAALNTGSDVDPRSPAPWPKPLVFPPMGAVMASGTFSGEWPDPLTACPGYKSPAGLPITLEFGHLEQPSLSDYSIKEAEYDGDSVAACAFDASTYVNPDPVAQNAARAVLSQFGAIVIVPRRPLSPGRYLVTVRVPTQLSPANSISVSLTIGGFSSNRVTIPVR